MTWGQSVGGEVRFGGILLRYPLKAIIWLSGSQCWSTAERLGVTEGEVIPTLPQVVTGQFNPDGAALELIPQASGMKYLEYL